MHTNIQTIVTVKCLDQVLQLINAPRITSGGVNDVRAEFEFCPLWDGLAKAAVFYTDPKKVYKQILEDDACDVPPEVLAVPGLMYMGVFGVNTAGDVVRTSGVLVLNIEQGAITEATAVSDPTPELYQQVLAEVQKAREVAEQTSEQQSTFESEVRQAVETVPEQAAAAGTQAAREAIEQLTPASIGAVDVNPQQLTEDQQAQARENIGAAAASALGGCWIEFTDEDGNPTDEPYLHWEEGGDGKKPDTTFSELLTAIGSAVSVEAQGFTEAQKAQARENIGAAAVGAGGGAAGNAVLYDAQDLTEDQQKQARNNIGAASTEAVEDAARVASAAGTAAGEAKTAAGEAEIAANEAKQAATNNVTSHNTNTDAHADIRAELKAFADRLNAVLDSDDETLDEWSELVAYIKSNKSLIDAITISKVNVSDIVDNLITNVANKPLSAAQGVALKGLIDAVSSSKLDANKLPEAVEAALVQAKASGQFDGANGTSVTVKSVSESTASGGSNVVTFSDGKTVTVKNGKDGAPGKTPEKGVDYLTPAELEAIVQQVIAALGTPVFGTVDLNKVITLNTDHLVDGTYQLGYEDETGNWVKICDFEKGVGITNMIPLSVNTDGTLYNGGLGYKKEYRISASSGSESAQSGYACTGFIPVKSGDTIYGSAGIMVGDTGWVNINFYDSAFARIKSANVELLKSVWASNCTIGADNSFVFSVKVTGNLTADELNRVAYFRMGSQGLYEGNAIITLNEPIE